MIFGIGAGRTGTQSLNEALNILGYNSIHFPEDFQTYEEIRKAKFNLSIFDSYNALTDLQAALYYEQFDRLYPESKFILTIRPSDEWIASATLHFDRHHATFTDNTKMLLTHFFGTYEVVNQERWVFCYERHNRNVLEYFRDRPQDLLILHLCEGEGWRKLCRFLEVPLPNVPFPHKNSSVQDIERLAHITKTRKLIL